VLPQGTFNYFSRTHGIPLDTTDATRALLAGMIRPVQVGLLNDRVFLVNASLGLYPRGTRGVQAAVWPTSPGSPVGGGYDAATRASSLALTS
jgi:diacylglycerol kinase family enzyme